MKQASIYILLAGFALWVAVQQGWINTGEDVTSVDPPEPKRDKSGNVISREISNEPSSMRPVITYVPEPFEKKPVEDPLDMPDEPDPRPDMPTYSPSASPEETEEIKALNRESLIRVTETETFDLR